MGGRMYEWGREHGWRIAAHAEHSTAAHSPASTFRQAGVSGGRGLSAPTL